jgi:hypothetical protein
MFCMNLAKVVKELLLERIEGGIVSIEIVIRGDISVPTIVSF